MATVSAIIRTKNRSDRLKGAVSSIFEQLRVPDEIIVVDDHSTDNTKDVCAHLCTNIMDKDTGAFKTMKVRYVLNEGNGLVDALNTGIRHARSGEGAMVWIIDDDNIPNRYCLHTLMGYLHENPQFGCVKGAAYGEEKRIHKTIPSLLSAYREQQREIIMRFIGTQKEDDEELGYYHPGLDNIGNCTLISRQALDEAGDGDRRCGRFHDMDTWITLRKLGYKPIHTKEPMTEHNQASSPKGVGFHKDRALTSIYLYKKHFNLKPLMNKLSFLDLLLLDVNYMCLKAVFVDRCILCIPMTMIYTIKGVL